MGQPDATERMLQKPILPFEPFMKWGLAFMGPIIKLVAAIATTAKESKNRYILVATMDYYTKWTTTQNGKKQCGSKT